LNLLTFQPLPLPVVLDVVVPPAAAAATPTVVTNAPSAFTQTAFDVFPVHLPLTPLSGGGNTPSEGTALAVDAVFQGPTLHTAGVLARQGEGPTDLGGTDPGGPSDPVATKALRLGSSLTEADDSVALVEVLLGGKGAQAPAVTPPPTPPAGAGGARRGAAAPAAKPAGQAASLLPVFLWPWLTFLAGAGAWVVRPGWTGRKRGRSG
jgi:hypothetical protein